MPSTPWCERRIWRQRKDVGTELIVLDLAVPRNVEPAARDLGGVRLFNLDDLQELRCPAAGHPSIAVAEAERILAEEMARLDSSLRARSAAPRLTELHRIGAALAREEAERALASLDSLSDVERQVVRDMADRLVRRVLYPVSRTLRAEEQSDEGDGEADGVRLPDSHYTDAAGPPGGAPACPRPDSEYSGTGGCCSRRS